MAHFIMLSIHTIDTHTFFTTPFMCNPFTILLLFVYGHIQNDATQPPQQQEDEDKPKTSPIKSQPSPVNYRPSPVKPPHSPYQTPAAVTSTPQENIGMNTPVNSSINGTIYQSIKIKCAGEARVLPQHNERIQFFKERCVHTYIHLSHTLSLITHHSSLITHHTHTHTDISTLSVCSPSSLAIVITPTMITIMTIATVVMLI